MTSPPHPPDSADYPPWSLATSERPRTGPLIPGQTRYDKGWRYRIMHLLIDKGYEVIALLFFDPSDGGQGWFLAFRSPGGEIERHGPYRWAREVYGIVEALPALPSPE